MIIWYKFLDILIIIGRTIFPFWFYFRVDGKRYPKFCTEKEIEYFKTKMKQQLDLDRLKPKNNFDN